MSAGRSPVAGPQQGAGDRVAQVRIGQREGQERPFRIEPGAHQFGMGVVGIRVQHPRVGERSIRPSCAIASSSPLRTIPTSASPASTRSTIWSCGNPTNVSDPASRSTSMPVLGKLVPRDLEAAEGLRVDGQNRPAGDIAERRDARPRGGEDHAAEHVGVAAANQRPRPRRQHAHRKIRLQGHVVARVGDKEIEGRRSQAARGPTPG